MTNNPNLYEINTAAWLYELSHKHGRPITLGQVPDAEWDRLQGYGFNLIWLMGVWKRCPSDKEYFLAESWSEALCNDILPGWTEDDIIGSPFAIEGYEPDPLAGGWDDIDRVRSELNRRNMKLILDFIPNHTGLDHPWHRDYPHYYVQVSKRQFERNPTDYYPVIDNDKMVYLANGKDPFFSPWTDTLQLNYFNPQTRLAMIEELVRIARHCDGFRCDMAMLVINDIFRETWGWTRGERQFELPEEEFWAEVREALPDAILIAESYWDTEWQLQQMGFDYTYDKKLYDRMETFSVQDIYLHLKADINFQKKLTRFIENHDEQRSCKIFGKEKIEAVAVLFATLPGMKLYHQGQLEGNTVKIPVQLRRVLREETDSAVNQLYQKLLSITSQEIFRDGEWQLRDVHLMSGDGKAQLIAYTWQYGDRKKLIAVNLSSSPARGSVHLGTLISREKAYTVIDELNGESYARTGIELDSSGMIVIRGPYTAHIFDISESE